MSMIPAITSAKQFGQLVRDRRKALKMTQRELALAISVGERFIVELEQGKETCQLGKSLRAAKAVGLRLIDEREVRETRDRIAHGQGGYDLSDLT
ncbi:MAG: hypothetical protein ACPGNT_01185 [Rhodospirillales bacterium]